MSWDEGDELFLFSCIEEGIQPLAFRRAPTGTNAKADSDDEFMPQNRLVADSALDPPEHVSLTY